MSQNWLNSSLWSKTTGAASVSSGVVNDFKSGKTDASGTFQSLLAGKLSTKSQTNSLTSKMNNSFGEMRASKKLDPPTVNPSAKFMDQTEAKPKVSSEAKSVETDTKSDLVSKKAPTSGNEKVENTDTSVKADLPVEQQEAIKEEAVNNTVSELNALLQLIQNVVEELPELKPLLAELSNKIESLAVGLPQLKQPEQVIKEVKSIIDALKGIQVSNESHQSKLVGDLKATLNQLTSSLEKMVNTTEQTGTFENVLKDLTNVLSEHTSQQAPKTEVTRPSEAQLGTVSSEMEQTPVEKLGARDPKSSNNENNSDPNGSKQKFSEVLKVNQDIKGTTEAKVTGHNFVSEMNAKVDSSAIAFGKTETTMGKTTLQQNILDQIINSPRMQVKQTELGTIMTMKLNPEVLGNVEIKLEIIKNVLQAEINVENMIVKGAIESNLSDLKNALSDKGYQVENLNVSVGKDGQQQSGHQQRQNEQNQKFVLDDEEASGKTYAMASLEADGTIDYLG